MGGCATNLNTDAVQRTNTALEILDQKPGVSPPSAYHDQEIRLWQDEPQYAALIDTPPTRRMRLISAVSPAYPPFLRMGHVNAKVIVSFVVGIDGSVEAARILESSDSRFNESALKAIHGFTFIPAQGANGPMREIAGIPSSFWWSAKAHNSSAG